MHHKIVYAQKSRRFGCFENFGDGGAPLRIVGRGDVDLGRERRVKRVRFHTEVFDFFGGTLRRFQIPKIQMLWRRTDLNQAETALTDQRQAVKNVSMAKAAG